MLPKDHDFVVSTYVVARGTKKKHARTHRHVVLEGKREREEGGKKRIDAAKKRER